MIGRFSPENLCNGVVLETLQERILFMRICELLQGFAGGQLIGDRSVHRIYPTQQTRQASPKVAKPSPRARSCAGEGLDCPRPAAVLYIVLCANIYYAPQSKTRSPTDRQALFISSQAPLPASWQGRSQWGLR